ENQGMDLEWCHDFRRRRAAVRVRQPAGPPRTRLDFGRGVGPGIGPGTVEGVSADKIHPSPDGGTGIGTSVGAGKLRPVGLASDEGPSRRGSGFSRKTAAAVHRRIGRWNVFNCTMIVLE